MIQRVVFSLLSLLLLSLSAQAGTVNGKIEWTKTSGSKTSQTQDKIVIWLEGGPELQPPANSLVIEQKELRFIPDFLVAVKGQKVELPNQDDVAHNVYSYSENSKFNFGLYPRGESRTAVFDKIGIVDMFCSVHRYMHARIFVVPTPYFAVARPNGTFSIPNIPAGTYTLKAWNDRARMFSKSIVVPKTGALTSDIMLDVPESASK
jgi:plastocyanin